MKYPFLFFDADHTLFDFDQAEAQSLARAVESLHNRSFHPEWLSIYKAANEAVWKAYELGQLSVGEVKRKRFQDFVDAAGLPVDPTKLSQQYVKELSSCALLLPDAESLLGQLAERGHRMLILTNGLSEIQRSRFAACSIANYFENFIISDELGVAKPAAGIFEAAMKVFDSPPKSDVLVIGDNLRSDILGGNNFGIATCWFNPQGFENRTDIAPDFEIRSLLDLLPQV